MSITYEEALNTLTSMFGSPWTQDELDTVLRHFSGHMENTVEALLAHGSNPPATLIARLEGGGDGGSSSLLGSSAESTSGKRSGGIGTPTDLPMDFLHIPVESGGNNTISDDEALARMIQDHLFAEELANNPEFAHLAPTAKVKKNRRHSSRRLGVPKQEWDGVPPMSMEMGEQHEGPNIMKGLADLGENAKKRLALFAAQWNAKNNQGGGGGDQPETKGLLDDQDTLSAEMGAGRFNKKDD